MTNERRTSTAGEMWEKESRRRELCEARSKEQSESSESSESSAAEVKQEKRDRKSKAA